MVGARDLDEAEASTEEGPAGAWKQLEHAAQLYLLPHCDTTLWTGGSLSSSWLPPVCLLWLDLVVASHLESMEIEPRKISVSALPAETQMRSTHI